MAAAGSVAALLTMAGPAAGAGPLHCGQDLGAADGTATTYTLYGNLDCSLTGAPALNIVGDNVTINLNGAGPGVITGAPGEDVINNAAGHDNLTINGPGGIQALGDNIDGVNNGAGSFLNVSNVTFTSDLGLPYAAVESDFAFVNQDFSRTCGYYGDNKYQLYANKVMNSSISGYEYGVYMQCNTGSQVTGSTITIPQPDGNQGVHDAYGTSNAIMNNTFAGSAPSFPYPNSGYGVKEWYSAGAVISGNSFTGLDRGVYSDNDGAGNAGLTISSNTMYHNDIGIQMAGGDAGDMISGNMIDSSEYNAIDDEHSTNNVYVGNQATGNGEAYPSGDYAAFNINSDLSGPVMMVNNVARVTRGWGFNIDKAFSLLPGGGYASPGPNSCTSDNHPWTGYSCFVGNIAFADGASLGVGGFQDFGSVGAVWMKNMASSNGYYGFNFISPYNAAIVGNDAHNNGGSGFMFHDGGIGYPGYEPAIVSGNTSTYNEEWGYFAENPIAGAGNYSKDNGSGDSWLLSGVTAG